MVVLMPKDISDVYHKLALELNMRPKLLDIHCNSFNRLLNLKHLNLVSEDYKEKNYLIIDIGYNNINAFIIEKGLYKFDRRIHSGLKAINSALEAHEEGIIGEDGHIKSVDFEDDGIKNELDYWVSEIQKILKFYQNNNLESTIDQVFIYGGGVSIKFLDMFLQKELQIKVNLIDVESFVELNDDLSKGTTSLYLNAMGALITSL